MATKKMARKRIADVPTKRLKKVRKGTIGPKIARTLGCEKERVLHGRAEKRNFSSIVEKYFTSERSERVKYFQHEPPFGAKVCWDICPSILGLLLFLKAISHYKPGGFFWSSPRRF